MALNESVVYQATLPFSPYLPTFLSTFLTKELWVILGFSHYGLHDSILEARLPHEACRESNASLDDFAGHT